MRYLFQFPAKTVSIEAMISLGSTEFLPKMVAKSMLTPVSISSEKTGIGRLSNGSEHVVGECGHLLIRFTLHRANNLNEEWLTRQSMHNFYESCHTDFGMLHAILVDGHQYVLDFARHNILKQAERINSFHTDGQLLFHVDDDFL
uniref:DUF1907 domain-containing protein n=1 Tax=Heterorhabditis bacteriophora TaxID=37862 RepID=A0A1I7WHR1_HETBA